MNKGINVALSVDALSPHLTGIGRYCLELSRGLPTAAGVKQLSCFRGNHWHENPEIFLEDDAYVQRNIWRQQFTDWRGRRNARKAIVHGPNYFLPSWAESGIVTVHDLSVLLYPDTHPVERLVDFEQQFQNTLSRTKAIITDSETVRREVIDTLDVPPDRVFAVPLGVTPSSTGSEETDTLLARLGLRRDEYTLCVSTFEPRKRIDHLVAAYGAIPLALRRAYPLVLVGASGWRNEDLNARIDSAQAQGWLKRLNFVSDPIRDALYEGARLFIYPSLYEGFGLPPLEAMSHGVPTMIGDAATLVEITRGAAWVVNVDDRQSFALDLAQPLEDQNWRRAASIVGREVALSYSWANCIAGTVEVYRSVAES